MRRIISLLLCALIIIGSFALSSNYFKTSAEVYDNILSYEITDGEVTINSCDNGISGTVVIPSSIDGYPVTCIGDGAFNDCKNISGVKIPDGVKTIKGFAFDGCYSLTDIIIPDSITSITSYAFYDTGYYRNPDNWKNDVLYIGHHLIKARESISGNYVIEPGTVSISDLAFWKCTELTAVTIPGSVVAIPYDAFSDCSKLISVSIANGVKSIEDYSFSGCEKLTAVTIPDSVKTIGSSAFCECTSLASVVFGNGLESIGESAFWGCKKLESITIPGNVKSLGMTCFWECSNLATITIEKGVSKIGGKAFYLCTDLSSINLPDSLIEIGTNAFLNTGYYNNSSNWENDSLYIGKHLIKVKETVSGMYAIKDGTVSIGCSAFFGNRELTSILIPDSVNSIGGDAFEGCSGLTSFDLPKNVKSIGDSTFNGCSGLTEITIPDGITHIGVQAFSWCRGVTSIKIPKSVIEIDDWAFSGCNDLTNITVDSGNPVYQSQNNCLIDTENKVLIQGCNNSVIPDNGSVTVIGNSAFADCDGLSNITIPNTIVEISDYAFKGCSGLTVIEIPNSVKNIGAYAFWDCSDLQQITIPDSVIKIGMEPLLDTAFEKTDSNWDNGILYCGHHLITSKEDISGNINIKSGTICIADASFANRSNLIGVNIPGTVVYIGNSAFYYCTKFSSILIPESVEYIGYKAFEGCLEITEVEIPKKITHIYYGTFEKMDGLKTVYIPKGVEIIDEDAFSDCEALTDVYYEGAKIDRKNISIGFYGSGYIKAANWHYNYGSDNIYKLGEETYSFRNFSDKHSGGHCHGMSVTSAGYYLGELDFSLLGLKSSNDVFSLTNNDSVKEAICYFQHIQGNYSCDAIVAGSITYLNTYRNWNKNQLQCWNETVNYVKSGKYDNRGVLQIQIWRKNGLFMDKGHGVNFLYYKKVNGQDRLYAYDNNFPNTEVYFYLDSDNKIREAPNSTMASIETICLIDLNKYFELANDYSSYKYIYADAEQVEIEGVSGYPLAGEDSAIMMYEIPAGIKQLKITPLVDNASVEYAENIYEFGEVEKGTYAILTLPTRFDDEGTALPGEIKFETNNNPTASAKLIVPANAEVEYAATVTVKAKATDVPEGYYVALYDGKTQLKKGSNTEVSYTFPGEFKETKNITVKIIDDNENVQKDADGKELTGNVEIKAKSGFFAKLIAFFKRLFRALPNVTVEPK